MAARMAIASLRKMLNERSSWMMGSPKKADECFGAQKPKLSLLASDQTSRSTSSADHSSASKSRMLSKRLSELANQRRSSHTHLFTYTPWLSATCPEILSYEEFKAGFRIGKAFSPQLVCPSILNHAHRVCLHLVSGMFSITS